MPSPEGTLAWPLEHAARVHGRRVAVVEGARELTYAELGRRVRGLGGALDRLGLARGAFVGVLTLNTLAHLECWLGVPAYGRTINALNVRLAPAELEDLVNDSGTEALVVDDAHLETARGLLRRCSSLRLLVHAGPGPCPDDCVGYEALVAGVPIAPPDLAGDTLAAISYTGGTTGRPKGVMLSHRNLLANAKHYSMAVGHTADDRYLHVAPMFHTADTSQTYCLTWAGGRHVIMPRFDPGAVADAIPRHGLTILVLVPTMIQALLDELDREPRDLSSVRLLIYAASPIARALQLRALETFAECDFRQGYGMTEAAPAVTMSTPEDHRRGAAGEAPFATRLGSVGPAMPGVQIEIRDAFGEPVAPGETGEVWVRGPNVMLGYWNRPGATRDALVDGWYRSGDAGSTDEDGYLYLVDRIKDMIVTGAENVYPAEVERVIGDLPGVVEVAVFGIPDPRWGEAVHATIVVRPGAALDADTVAAACRERIAGFKVPRSVVLQEEPLPKSGPGKILKRVLREPYWEGRERRVG